MKMYIHITLILCLFNACTMNRYQKSKNYKNGKFINSQKIKSKSFFSFMKMRMSTKWNDWPDFVDINVGDAPDKKVEDKVKFTLINHSTVLIQLNGLNILSDPIYSERCSPVQFAGPKRVHKPGIKFNDLPPIDIIIISHDHYDHLDLDTIDNLIKRDNPKIYMGLGVAKHIDGGDKIELDWWDSSKYSNDLNVNFVEVQHFSGRTLFDRNESLWGGFVLEFNNKKIYFGGDSGYGPHYTKTFQKFGSMDYAFLPIGAYAPRSFMKPMHMNPEEAVMAHNDLVSKHSFGIHYGTFQLTAEKREEPILMLKKHRKNINPNSSFDILDWGKTISFH